MVARGIPFRVDLTFDASKNRVQAASLVGIGPDLTGAAAQLQGALARDPVSSQPEKAQRQACMHAHVTPSPQNPAHEGGSGLGF